ncbi:MAG: Histidinol-phosphate aminotransferase 2 [Deltaproteobacteria bacterium ADurb.Bin510]|nr:MAG: Histidinol-phosphate aminotransferase 2 [Deltaproteobacteria bacterium ADurb.Bin510]
MNQLKPARHLAAIPAYAPGRSKEEIARAYGVAKPIKLASNENPLGPSPKAIAAMQAALSEMHLYPDATAAELRDAAASHFGCAPENIIAGNGSDEILDLICRAYLNPGDRVLIPACTFSYYRIAALACAAECLTAAMNGFSLDAEQLIEGLQARPKLVFIANPNNPTGTALGASELSRILDAADPQTLVVVDEAYAAFARQTDFKTAVALIERPNLIVVKTLSKSHGLAGLRIGFGIAHPAIINELNRLKPPFNVNRLGLIAGAAALTDDEFLQQTLELNWSELDRLYAALDELGLAYVASQTNFVLVRLGQQAAMVYEELLRRGVITRYGAGPGLDEYLRVSIGRPEENRQFVASLKAILQATD